jgi:hypothetical protein
MELVSDVIERAIPAIDAEIEERHETILNLWKLTDRSGSKQERP